MSKSVQKQQGNTVGGDSTQRSNADNATQTVETSNIQGSLTQEVLVAKKETIERVLKDVHAALERLGLQEEEKTDIKAQVETAQAQMNAKKPDPGIINACLKSIWKALKGVAAAAAASAGGSLAKELANQLFGLFQ